MSVNRPLVIFFYNYISYLIFILKLLLNNGA